MSSLYERSLKVLPPVASRVTTLGVETASGCYFTTEDGRTIMDLGSGIAVCNLGHNHPEVAEAAKKQIDKVIHPCHNLVYYEPYISLAEKLVELTGGETKVYFSNSGSEANEGAVKLAKYATQRPAVISFKGAFHGRTLMCTSLTASNAKYRKHYEGLMPSVYFAEFPNLYRTPYQRIEGEDCPIEYFTQFDELFKTVIDPYSVAAIIMEPIQGEGGYVVPPRSFVQYVREVCDKYGILLIFDEVQTGFGRTGKMFAYEHFGVEPDILTCAKGIANGFPLSAYIAKKEIMDKWEAGAHGGTFGGNPVSCAASMATIDVLTEEGFLEDVAEKGAYFKAKVEGLQAKYSGIGEVRGVGMMIGMEMVYEDRRPNTELTTKVQTKALEKELFLLTCGVDKNVVRFIPPLIITKEEIDKAITIVDTVFAEIEAGHS